MKKSNFQYTNLPIFLILMVLFGCSSIPGKSGEEQAKAIDKLVSVTLTDLYKQEPETKAKIANSVGYVIMNNKITKIPLIGAGKGYGVAIETANQDRTYVKMTRFDIGGGWGARSVRMILIFSDKDKYQDFIDGVITAKVGAEAAAKVGDVGAAGGASGNELSKDKGYSSHMITDAGVSGTVTAGIIRIKTIELKK